MIRNQGAHSLDAIRSGSACNEHQLIGTCPFARFDNDLLVQWSSCSLRLDYLEVVAARIRRRGEQDSPLVLESKEGLDRVSTHVGRNRDRIEIHLFEEGAGI